MKDNLTILITGGSSSVGQSLISLLPKTAIIYCLNHSTPLKADPRITIVKSDLRDAVDTLDALAEVSKLDCIVHLAGITDAHISLGRGAYEDNVSMANTIVSVAQQKQTKRLFFLSSNSVNYSQRHYALSKAKSEKILQGTEIPLTIFRPTLIVSHESPEIKSLVALIRKLPAIPLVDGGSNQVHPVTSPDIASAIILAMNERLSAGKTYTLSNDVFITIKEIVDCLISSFQLHKPIFNIPTWFAKFLISILKLARPDTALILQDSFLQTTAGDNSLVKKDLHWTPEPVTCQILISNFR